MSVFKCKMCGGTLEIQPNATVAECEYCGTTQTLPKLDDGRKANLFDRANHFRRNNEFDKAANIYEQILNEDGSDAETYWSLVLCRYGIEYVEDPATHKRVPTVNRAQFTSIFDDDNYKSALNHADGYQRSIYEDEAKAINEIQKGILAISQREEPFDVFICYKETDHAGRRTSDSVLATELYHQLTQEGFMVFFSRITLEDKLGTAYEPYIFAALNSAKVMVVLGTNPEYFNAVWVKNEWSRYLALIKSGAKKLLIPAYKDMDPYDLPEEFSHLQAQDMSKLGFMQDLIRGIKKILADTAPKPAANETVVVNQAPVAGIAPLLKRAFMFLEDGDWKSANEYCEKVLDQDPENAQAYLGKLMAELRVQQQGDLKNCRYAFDGYNSYQKILRFADKALCEELKGYIRHIEERNEHDRLENLYARAADRKAQANSEDAYKQAAEAFAEIPGYRDADSQKQECLVLAENARKDAIYEQAMTAARSHVIDDVEDAVKQLQTISGWKDAEKQIYECQQIIERLKAEAEAEQLEKARQAEIEKIAAAERTKRYKKIGVIAISAVAICMIIFVLLTTVIIPNFKYKKAVALMDVGQYEIAYSILVDLGDYKNAEGLLKNYTAIYRTKIEKRGKYTNIYIYEYDSNWNPIKETYKGSDGSITTTTYRYNNAGKLIREIRGSITIEYSYDSAGNLSKKVQTYTYDGNVEKTTIEYSYDSAGNLIKEVTINPNRKTSSCEYRYDSSGKLVEEIGYSGPKEDYTTEYNYDVNGNVVKKVKTESDGIKHTTKYKYDAAGRLIEKVSPYFMGGETTTKYSYDIAGNLIKEVQDPPGIAKSTTKYSYENPIVRYISGE